MVDCRTFQGNWSYEAASKYCLLVESKPVLVNEKSVTKDTFYAYNTIERKLENYCSEIIQDKHIGNLLCDRDGKFWGAYSYNNENYFFYIDFYKQETVIVDNCEQIIPNQERFSPIFIDNEYVIYGNIGYTNADEPIEDYSKFTRLKIYSLAENRFISEIPIIRKTCIYGVSIFHVNDAYKLMLSDGNNNIFFCDFSFDMTEIIPDKEPNMNFWFNSNVFVRGDKIYLVHSGFSEVYKLTYFDFESNTQGPLFELKVDNITNTAKHL